MRTSLKQDNSEIPLLLKTLKNLFKSKGILYHDVATALNVSETTIKRYLTGHSLTVDVLESLCKVVDLRLSDLLDLSRDEAGSDNAMISREVEERLAEEPFLSSLLHLMAKGYSPGVLQRDFEIPDAEMNHYLTMLDRLGLIQLFPYNRIRLRVGRNFNVEKGGPLMRLARDALVYDFFAHFDVATTDWSFGYFKLSKASMERARALLTDFLAALEAIAEKDRDLPMDLAEWQSMFVMLHPIDIGALRTWKPATSPQRSDR